MKEQNIITKIISDAENKAEQTVADAHRRAEQIIAAAQKQAEDYRAEQLSALSEKHIEAVRRAEINARLDVNKITLAARREVLESVFETALKTICTLPESDYLTLMEMLFVKFAEYGDRVVLSKNCAYEDKISSLPVFVEKGLSIESARGDFAGGALLLGKECDKNVSFEALIQAYKEENQAEIAAKLFRRDALPSRVLPAFSLAIPGGFY